MWPIKLTVGCHNIDMAALLVWNFTPIPTAAEPWAGREHHQQSTADRLLAESDEDVVCNCTRGYYGHILWTPPLVGSGQL